MNYTKEQHEAIENFLKEKSIVGVMGYMLNSSNLHKGAKEEAKQIHCEHRYLQGEIYRQIEAVIVEMAYAYDQKRYDPRNEHACRCCAMIRNCSMEKIGDRWFVKSN